jgi:hypothetical protein
MKTLIKLDSNLSVYVFDDAEFISQNLTSTTIGNPVKFYILDCNTDNSKIIDNVTPPTDWVGSKYTFVNKKWAINSEYVKANNGTN